MKEVKRKKCILKGVASIKSRDKEFITSVLITDPILLKTAYDGTCVHMRKSRKLKDLVLEKYMWEMHLEIVVGTA